MADAMANPTIPGMRSKMLTGGLLFMPAMFQHFGMNSMNKLPETEPQKAWIPSHMRRPWEAPEWNAMPVDTGRKAYIIPNFLSDAEVDHIMYNVVPKAAFDVPGLPQKSWSKFAPLAGGGLLEPKDTDRYQDALNWTEAAGKGEGPDEVLSRIEHRIVRLTGIPFHDRESPLSLTVNSPHKHSGVPIGSVLHHDRNVRKNRVVSVISFLSGGEESVAAPLQGGEMLFPCLKPDNVNPIDENAPSPPPPRMTLFERYVWLLHQFGGAQYKDKTVCERLHISATYGIWVLPHPNDREANEKAQQPEDPLTPTQVAEMCVHEGSEPPKDYFKFTPRRGDALLYLSTRPENGTMHNDMWHMGCPVLQGTSYKLEKYKEVWNDGYGPEFDMASAIGWDEEEEWNSQYRELYGGSTQSVDATGTGSSPVPTLDDIDPLS